MHRLSHSQCYLGALNISQTRFPLSSRTPRIPAFSGSSILKPEPMHPVLPRHLLATTVCRFLEQRCATCRQKTIVALLTFSASLTITRQRAVLSRCSCT